MVHSDNPVVEFTALDRCDGCGAQAYVSASRDGHELLFCAHHFKQHDRALENDGWTIAVDTIKLEELRPAGVGA